MVGEATVGALRSALARDAARRGTGVKQALRDLFSALMSAEAGAMEASCKALAARLARLPAGQKSGDDELAQRLYAQYPDDVGVFCVSAGLKWPQPCLTTPPHLPPWTV